jgi:hypothetical protein
MSNSVIGSLRVNLGLDSARFTRGLSQAQKNLAVAQKQFAAIGGAAALAFGAVATAALAGARAIDANAKAARRIGATVAGYRALEMAADDAGVSLSSLANDVQTMNRELARAAAGEGAAGDALQRLGLTADDLAGMDADEKIATLADRVKELGLDSGQTTLLLRDLGVRNREMALLVMGGGAALRAARVDVQEFGLALADVDAARIEAANDEIAGLADITTYIGDQLALKFVPAMGNMAKAMTDSLRAGGALRSVIDGLLKNLDVMAVSIGAAVVAMGAKVVVLAALASGTGAFTAALGAARVAVAALLGPMGLVYVAIGAAAAAFIGYRNQSDAASVAMDGSKKAASELSIELGLLASSDLPAASAATVALANDNLTLASTSFEAARAQLELAKANAQAAFVQSSTEDAFLPGVENPGRARLEAANRAAAEAANALNEAEAELNRRIAEGNAVKVEASEVILDVSDALTDAAHSGANTGAALETIDAAASDLAVNVESRLIPAVDGIADAFADFAMRGFRDFKSFARSIMDTFKDLLRQMIATAAKNKIMISLGMGGSVAGTAASAGSGLLSSAGMFGGIGAGLSAFAGGIGSGLSVVGSGFAAGGLSGAATAGMGAFTGGIGMGGMAGFGTALGAALPVVGAVALVFGALRKRTKELDSGIKVSVDGLNVAAESFRKMETSRFFGLSRRTSTTTTADPIVGAAVSDMQTAIRDMASQLDVGVEAFNGFTYDFRVSLKGLSQEAAAQKVAEQVAMLGDAFAGMIPHITDLNELMSVVQERFQLETRLLQLQGDTTALRERELDGVNALNRGILEQIFAFEDMQAAAAVAAEAFEKGNAAIQRTMDLFRSPLSLDSNRFTDRFTASIQAAEDRRFQIQKEADNAQLTELKLLRAAFDGLRKETRDQQLYGSNA